MAAFRQVSKDFVIPVENTYEQSLNSWLSVKAYQGKYHSEDCTYIAKLKFQLIMNQLTKKI